MALFLQLVYRAVDLLDLNVSARHAQTFNVLRQRNVATRRDGVSQVIVIDRGSVFFKPDVHRDDRHPVRGQRAYHTGVHLAWGRPLPRVQAKLLS